MGLSTDAWGQHLLIDAVAGNRAKVTDPAHIAGFAAALVDGIGMQAFGPPQVVHFGHADPGTAGYTLVQLIETSNITAHFVDGSGNFYLDVFSCRPFNAAAVLKLARLWFEPEQVTSVTLPRGAGR